MRRIHFCILLLLIPILTAFAQERLHVFRLTSQVVFDGIPDEPAWNDCPICPMVMNAPEFGKPATERTEILLGYDDLELP